MCRVEKIILLYNLCKAISAQFAQGHVPIQRQHIIKLCCIEWEGLLFERVLSQDTMIFLEASHTCSCFNQKVKKNMTFS